jgi:putative transcriptional regulator
MIMDEVAIRRIRGEVSQSDFAEWLGIPVRTLQEWEQGQRLPSTAADALLKLADSGALQKPRR